MAKKILLVDDSQTIRAQAKIALGSDFECIEAEDGQKGLEALKKHSDICLVLCDVNMPIMDGITMLETIQKDEILNKIPVIMLTTMSRADLIQRAKQAGAKGWLIKSLDNSKLIAAVKKFAS